MAFVGTQDTQLKIGTVPAKPGHLVTLSQVIIKRGKRLSKNVRMVCERNENDSSNKLISYIYYYIYY